MQQKKEPSSTSVRMAKVRQQGTEPELVMRRELYRAGLHYRVGFVALKSPRRVVDIAFPGLKIAVFIDGCFWHGCPEHASWPKKNADFWRSKIEANQSRDADTNLRLQSIGWQVIRIWEHELPEAARDVIAAIAVMKKKKSLT